MKTDSVYKQAFNRVLDLIGSYRDEKRVVSEGELARRTEVSRTTARKVAATLVQRGIVGADGAVIRLPTSTDYFPDAQTVSKVAHVEKQFLELMLRGGAKPGTTISELELARQFGVATSVIREFLINFSRFGLIEKRSNSGWIFSGFTLEFALELFEIRELFELRSALAFARQPPQSPIWEQLEMLRQEHETLLANIADHFHDFSDLDDRFHRLVNSASPNRFIDSFYDVISFIFHYHYQWNKQDELPRNEAAIREHLTYIDALVSRDEARIDAACHAHLASARQTLLRATGNS